MTDHIIRSTSHRRTDQAEERQRHWARSTQEFAPADVLITHLQNGWQFVNPAAVETFYSGGFRRADIYYFTLQRGEEIVEMPVLANPKISRLIEEHQLTVLRVNVMREEDD